MNVIYVTTKFLKTSFRVSEVKRTLRLRCLQDDSVVRCIANIFSEAGVTLRNVAHLIDLSRALRTIMVTNKKQLMTVEYRN